jgi:hypothetical protein
MKDEKTLEEAAEKYANELPEPYNYGINSDKKKGFIAGANWQQERLYSYDELRKVAYNAYCLGQLIEPTEGKFNLWIQQFKKK